MPEERERTYGDDLDESAIKEVENQQLKRKVKKQKAALDSRIEKLKKMAQDQIRIYGIDSDNVQFTLDILESVMQMREMIETVEAFGVALECLGELTGAVDMMFGMNETAMQALQGKKIKAGFFARLKRRIEIRRQAQAIEDKLTDAFYIMEEYRDIFANLSGALRNIVRRKRTSFGRKRKKSGEDNNDRARRLILADNEKDRAAGSGGNSGEEGSGVSGASEGSSSSGNGGSGGSGGNSIYDL